MLMIITHLISLCRLVIHRLLQKYQNRHLCLRSKNEHEILNKKFSLPFPPFPDIYI